ncbi:MAG: 23S rRNA (adenine(2503)-C(2))-methyltransferase RlmN [Microgenomates group bacterium]
MLTAFLTRHTIPSYRITQFYQAYYKEFISSFDALSTWSKEERKAVCEEIPFSSIVPVKQLQSASKDTEKVVFSRADKKCFETVLMKHTDGRNTVCVSSMIGCPVGCTFCATGKMGYLGNVTTNEIVDQVLYFARLLKQKNQTVTNIVFMGMGEPLLNLSAVEEAISIFTDPEKMGMSERRITISTSGITDKLQELLRQGYKGRLALSLHAPNQKIREQIMPIAKKYPLQQVLDVCATFATDTNKRVSYEYILIDGVNDTIACATQLASIMDPKLSHINLIPYNPVADAPYRRSSPAAIYAFAQVLEKQHIQHTIRVTMGDDIAAACGQLAGNV